MSLDHDSGNGVGNIYDPAVDQAITNLGNAGVTVLGWVATSDAEVALDKVKDEVNRYHTWYPSLHGIFFAEMGTDAGSPTMVQYYQDVSDYAKNTVGFSVTWVREDNRGPIQPYDALWPI